MDHPVALILGLGREVGGAVARRFAETGHGVVAVDPDPRRIAAAQEQVDDRVTLSHGPTDTELGLRNALALAVERHGHIDHLILIPRLPVSDTLVGLDRDRFAQALTSITLGTSLAVELFAEKLAQQEDAVGARAAQSRQRGSVVFILSLHSRLQTPGRFTQNVTQGAAQAVMQAAALEFAPARLRVNAISALRPRAQEQESWLKKRTPLGRPALADEIADAAIFLSSSQSAIITGETLVLDGGRSRLSGLIE